MYGQCLQASTVYLKLALNLSSMSWISVPPNQPPEGCDYMFSSNRSSLPSLHSLHCAALNVCLHWVMRPVFRLQLSAVCILCIHKFVPCELANWITLTPTALADSMNDDEGLWANHSYAVEEYMEGYGCGQRFTCTHHGHKFDGNSWLLMISLNHSFYKVE